MSTVHPSIPQITIVSRQPRTGDFFPESRPRRIRRAIGSRVPIRDEREADNRREIYLRDMDYSARSAAVKVHLSGRRFGWTDPVSFVERCAEITVKCADGNCCIEYCAWLDALRSSGNFQWNAREIWVGVTVIQCFSRFDEVFLWIFLDRLRVFFWDVSDLVIVLVSRRSIMYVVWSEMMSEWILAELI